MPKKSAVTLAELKQYCEDHRDPGGKFVKSAISTIEKCKQYIIGRGITMEMAESDILAARGAARDTVTAPTQAVIPAPRAEMSSMPVFARHVHNVRVGAAKMFHIADLHIRVENEDQLKFAFEQLRHHIDAAGASPLLVVAGDVFDRADNLSRQNHATFNAFLAMFRDVPMVLISGNHDRNIHGGDSVRDHVDMLAESRENVFYLGGTSIHAFDEGRLVFVTAGEEDIRHPAFTDTLFASIAEFPSTTRIVLVLHVADDESVGRGGVCLAEKLRLPLPPNVICMLGDIHLRHFAGGRPDSRVAYAGSIVQQNFGEPVDGHGMLIWAAGSPPAAVDFAPFAPRLSVSVTRDAETGQLCVKLPEGCEQLMKSSRQAIVRADISANLREQDVETELKKVFGENVLKRVTFRQEAASSCPVAALAAPDVACIHDEFRRILREKLKSDPLAGEIMSIHEELLSSVRARDGTARAQWSVRRLTWKNMLGYGGDIEHTVNFEDGITRIVGANSSGKSSLVRILLFSIFGRDRDVEVMVNMDARERSAMATSEVVLTVGDKEVRVIRYLVKMPDTRKYAERYSSKPGFVLEVGGERRGGKESDLSAELSAMIGTSADSLYLSVMSHAIGLDSNVLGMSAAETESLIERMIGSSDYKKLHELCRRHTNELSTKAAALAAALESMRVPDDPTPTIVEYEEKIRQYEGRAQKFREDLAESRRIQSDIRDSVILLEREMYEKSHSLVSNADKLRVDSERLAREVGSETCESLFAQLEQMGADTFVEPDPVEITGFEFEFAGLEKRIGEAAAEGKQGRAELSARISAMRQASVRKLWDIASDLQKRERSVEKRISAIDDELDRRSFEYECDGRLTVAGQELSTTEDEPLSGTSRAFLAELCDAVRDKREIVLATTFGPIAGVRADREKCVAELAAVHDLIEENDARLRKIEEVCSASNEEFSGLCIVIAAAEEKEKELRERAKEVCAKLQEMREKLVISGKIARCLKVLGLIDLAESARVGLEAALAERRTVCGEIEERLATQRALSKTCGGKSAEIVTKIAACEKYVNDAGGRVSVLRENVIARTRVLEDKSKKATELAEADASAAVYRRYMELAFGDDPIRSRIVAIFNERITEMANAIIRENCPALSVRRNAAESFAAVRGTHKLDRGCSGGFEGFVINLALKMALSDVSSVSHMNCFIVDEEFDCIDETNSASIPALVERVMKKNRVMLYVTHRRDIAFGDSEIVVAADRPLLIRKL